MADYRSAYTGEEIDAGIAKANTAAQPGDLPTVNNATLTIQQNGTTVGTFTANSSTDATVNLADTTYSAATTSTAGLMSASDKTKLNGIETNAQKNVQADWDETDESEDSYILNKPTIPAEVTESTVSGWGFTKNTGTYSKPSGGIPKTDLANDVQESLENADTVSSYFSGGGSESYTNLLDVSQVSLNKRWNSSGQLVDATGYVALPTIDFASDTVNYTAILRINRPVTVLVPTTSGKNCRVALCDSNGNRTGYAFDGKYINNYTPVETEDGYFKCNLSKRYATYGDPTTEVIDNTSPFAKVQISLYLGTSTVVYDDISDLVVTRNERIIEGPTAVQLNETVELPLAEEMVATEKEERETEDARLEALIENAGTKIDYTVYAPSPQLPADGTSTSDFNAATIGANDIYTAFDALVEKYPNYITKEVYGKDESGTYDLVRYTLCKHYFNAWYKENYPKMYAWKNGNTIIYSTTVSPNVGATMYSTAYVGTSVGTVTSVDNINDTRTVSDTVYTRSSTDDVEPTLVYTSQVVNKVLSAGFSDISVYQLDGTKLANISTIDGTAITNQSKTLNGNVMIDANSVTYYRYPLGDLDGQLADASRLTTKYKPVTTGKKVVVLGANEHGPNGDPREPAICAYRLAKDLCERENADNYFINYLKNNIKIVIIPVINPYGFTNGGSNNVDGYFNYNGVNINRNYDTKSWVAGTGDSSAGDYGGSEIETRFMMDTLQTKDAIVGISAHCLGASSTGSNDGMMAFQGNNFVMNELGEIAENLKANYNITLIDYGIANPETLGGAGKSPAYITKAGLRGGIIEMNARDGYVGEPGVALHDAEILEACYTWLLSALNMWISDANS